MEGVSLVFTILFFLGSLISIIWGVYIIRLNSKSSINRVFLFLCIALSIWSLGFAMANSTVNMKAAVFWRRFASIGMTSLFAFILHFLILLTRQDDEKEPSRALYLLYTPALISMYGLSFSAETAAVQYDLIRTSYGLTNVAANSNWNYFYYAYYALYMIISLGIIWKWRRRLDGENKKSANIILLTIFAASILGSIVDITFTTFMRNPLPQMSPLFILMPVWAMYYSAKHYGMMNLGETYHGEIIASDEEIKNIFKNISLGFYIGSILAFAFNYMTYVDQGITFENTLLKSLLFISIGILISFIQRIKRESVRGNLTILILVLSIPLITIQYMEYGGKTIWAYPMIIIISSVIFSKLNLLILTTGISIVTQLAMWIVNPEIAVVVDKYDYFIRIIIFIIVFLTSLYINKMYIRKIREHTYQTDFQEMASDISFQYVSSNKGNFNDKVNYQLEEMGKFFKVDRTYLFTIDRDRQTMTYSNEWSKDGVKEEVSTIDKVPLDVFPWWIDQLENENLVYIEDVDVMPEEAINEHEELKRQEVKSLISVPIYVKGEMVAFIGLDSVGSKKDWTDEYIEMLNIMANILSSAKTQLKSDKEIELMAYYDDLTSLPNRFLFEKKVNKAIKQSKDRGKLLAIMFIDLDNFKVVNDTIGHKGGDELLTQVAEGLSNSIGKSDIAARFGGDEFMIMIDNIANYDVVNGIADRIMKIFSDLFTIEDQDFLVTASAGIAVYPEDGDDPETLIKNADIAMYEAKAKGKNQYSICTEEIKKEVERNMELSKDLHKALEKDQLRVYYQPQVDLPTGEIIGLEALARWIHPKRGMISPREFIPIAEDNGSINAIGEWVLKTACLQNKKWHDMGLGNLKIAVNLSAVQIIDSKIVEKIEAIIKSTGLDPKYIELELTEGVAVQESDYVLDVLNRLKDLGVSLAIDDFGTEYSSLSRLKELPIDRIKIDMQYIQGIETNDKDKAITMVIISLAKNLGLNVLAEGVETSSQLDFLNQKMCEYGQGFYYYEPMPAEEVEEILKEFQENKGK